MVGEVHGIGGLRGAPPCLWRVARGAHGLLWPVSDDQTNMDNPPPGNLAPVSEEPASRVRAAWEPLRRTGGRGSAWL
jgi:hypothetical protein